MMSVDDNISSLQLHDAATSNPEKTRILACLGANQSKKLIQRCLEFALSVSFCRHLCLLGLLMHNPVRQSAIFCSLVASLHYTADFFFACYKVNRANGDLEQEARSLLKVCTGVWEHVTTVYTNTLHNRKQIAINNG